MDCRWWRAEEECRQDSRDFLQLYFRRAKQAEVMYGDADLHREVVAQAIGL